MVGLAVGGTVGLAVGLTVEDSPRTRKRIILGLSHQIAIHIVLHITGATRHFGTLPVEPVPTIPGARADSAQGV